MESSTSSSSPAAAPLPPLASFSFGLQPVLTRVPASSSNGTAAAASGIPHYPPSIDVGVSTAVNSAALTPRRRAVLYRRSSDPGSPSLKDTAAARSLERGVVRKRVSEWAEGLLMGQGVGAGTLTGAGTDGDFRARLRDGTMLCGIVNEIEKGIVPKVFTAEELHAEGPFSPKVMDNVRSFLDAARQLGVPEDRLFEPADLEETATEEATAQVVSCLSELRLIHQRVRSQRNNNNNHFNNSNHLTGAMAKLGAAHITNGAAAMERSASMNGNNNNNDGAGFDTPDNTSGAGGLGLATAGVSVSRWMQQCALMLRDRLRGSQGSTQQLDKSRSSADTMEVMGPVLEQVLGGLMAEYEKRLVTKDQLVAKLKESLDEAIRRVDKLTQRNTVLEQFANGTQMELHAYAAQLKKSEDEKQSLRDELRSEINLLHASRSSEISRLQEERRQELARVTAAASAETMNNDVRGLMDAVREQVDQQQKSCEADMQVLAQNVSEMAYMAANYRKVCEENRRLYNEVQDLKGNIRVYCRVRPLTRQEAAVGDSVIDYIGDDGEIIIAQPKTTVHKQFTFDRIFGPDSTQMQVFTDTQPLVRSVLDGYNVCIFAYGQTGSGKTYTMSGPQGPYELNKDDLGVNYRALDDLFALGAKRSNEWEYAVSVQMLEIYNEQLRDLLSATQTHTKKLDILCTNVRDGLNVPDATLLPVSTTRDVLDVMNTGLKNRAVGSTAMNERSSRSHSVLTVHVTGSNRLNHARVKGCLHLVDLAGSERVSRSEASGERLKEAQHINKSLSALGDVMAALASNSQHVPYRNSKLTTLLQDSLGGQAKTLMFTHISPDEISFGETMSTLNFAHRVSTITLGAAKKNTESGAIKDTRDQLKSAESELRQLREQVRTAQTTATKEKAARGDGAERQVRQLEADAAKREAEVAKAQAAAIDAKDKARAAEEKAERVAKTLAEREAEVRMLKLAISSRPKSDSMAARDTTTTTSATTTASSAFSKIRPPTAPALAIPTDVMKEITNAAAVANDSANPNNILKKPATGAPTSKLPEPRYRSSSAQLQRPSSASSAMQAPATRVASKPNDIDHTPSHSGTTTPSDSPRGEGGHNSQRISASSSRNSISSAFATIPPASANGGPAAQRPMSAGSGGRRWPD
eukprot:jgi/Chlat1/5754/Chrsp38S05577